MGGRVESEEWFCKELLDLGVSDGLRDLLVKVAMLAVLKPETQSDPELKGILADMFDGERQQNPSLRFTNEDAFAAFDAQIAYQQERDKEKASTRGR